MKLYYCCWYIVNSKKFLTIQCYREEQQIINEYVHFSSRKKLIQRDTLTDME